MKIDYLNTISTGYVFGTYGESGWSEKYDGDVFSIDHKKGLVYLGKEEYTFDNKQQSWFYTHFPPVVIDYKTETVTVWATYDQSFSFPLKYLPNSKKKHKHIDDYIKYFTKYLGDQHGDSTVKSLVSSLVSDMFHTKYGLKSSQKSKDLLTTLQESIVFMEDNIKLEN
ncbi:hypothetical protein [Vibrio phage JSF13]|jgi:hypothetical protein|nr:hypothetical protein TUST1-159_00750 [Vibrio phage ICP1_2006_B]ADX88876.1 hypothetical protein TUST1-17_00750 [Vibrio phage ICP1_2006_A]ADX89564.1 hypothetical protein TUST1-10_00760 [Vibrio phage ICP1_2004_A]ASV41239.1 hypothetical protein [Vibrio phage JSF5]ASV41474.1 hypothetical protein [Vibrio phage JSF6]ASV42135.1 hypothetical protein [Vibrio phage JSF13]ASV42513.1 hypothetical protein [Vibrio phage JSF14]ASV42661.1 hypothetical protein [Vibrio phage JSF17]AXQ70778.1 hypothetical p